MKFRAGILNIIVAVLVIEVTTAVMYYSAQNIIQTTMEKVVMREMNAIYLCIRNKLAQVEVTINNMSWVVSEDLSQPDSLLIVTRQLVEHNPTILGSSISCIPDYFPEKGRWYEPYSVRRSDGTIESMQLGSARHDYTKAEFFTAPIEKGSGHWCEPYMDRDGAKAKVTTYSVPVRNGDGKIVAVIDADISLHWLKDIMNQEKAYKSMQRFLVTGNYNLLAGEDSQIYRAALEHLKADDDKKGYVELYDEHGDKKHVYFTPVGGLTKWMLISVLDDDDVYKKLRTIRQSLLLSLMIGLFFAGFIIYRSSRNMGHLRKVKAEKERIGVELRVASRIQQSMLPPEEFSDEGLALRGYLKPAREVGGDLYDYFIRDGKLFFCIGDVSGKGTASAMLMAVTRALFRSASAHESNPAHIMQSINETICQGNKSNMFVTIFIGVLDLPTGHLRYCDAGHDAPFLMHNSQCIMLNCNPNLPIGVFDDVKYGIQENHLQPDSTIFLYTDGLTEAMNCQHEQFGMQNMVSALTSSMEQKESPKNMLKTVTQKVHEFVQDAEQSDDLTMLVINYTPKKCENIQTETLVIKNDIHEMTRFGSFMKSVIEKMNIEKTLANKLRLAVEEAVVNVISYAYPADTEGSIDIRMMNDGNVLRFMIIDSGVAFDPTTKEKVDTTLSVEDRQIGGLGILLVRELMDSINYERIEKKNVLTLTKNL